MKIYHLTSIYNTYSYDSKWINKQVVHTIVNDQKQEFTWILRSDNENYRMVGSKQTYWFKDLFSWYWVTSPSFLLTNPLPLACRKTRSRWQTSMTLHCGILDISRHAQNNWSDQRIGLEAIGVDTTNFDHTNAGSSILTNQDT